MKVAGKVAGNAQTADAARRALFDEPTLYEAQHAASAFGLELLSPEPIADLPPAPLDAFDEHTRPESSPGLTPRESTSASRPQPVEPSANPWEEATHVPPLSNQPTQALPQLAYAAITEVRHLHHQAPSCVPPPGSSTPQVLVRQRLYYPFLVGTIGGLCGLLVAILGLRVVKEQRDRAQRTAAQTRSEQQLLMDQALRAFLSGRPQEARVLLWDYDRRWPTPAVEQLRRSLESQPTTRPLDPKDRR